VRRLEGEGARPLPERKLVDVMLGPATVDWGDVPAWVASVGTVLTLGFAVETRAEISSIDARTSGQPDGDRPTSSPHG
jgi:hypothetical protein